MTHAELELRAELERALLLLDRIGEYAHNEECQPKNDCENGHDTEACHFDEELDDHVHNHTSCDCLVWDAATRAKSIRVVLERTMTRTPQPIPGSPGGSPGGDK